MRPSLTRTRAYPPATRAAGDGVYHVVPNAKVGMGNLSFSVTASYTADDVMRTLFDLSGVIFSISPAAMDVGSPSAGTVHVRDFASFDNNNRGGAMCASSTYLTSEDTGRYASWPADTEATLEFAVGADGVVAAPTIDGKPFEPIAFPHDPSWVPDCQPVLFEAGAPLVLGTGARRAPFKGAISDMSVNYVCNQDCVTVNTACCRPGQWCVSAEYLTNWWHSASGYWVDSSAYVKQTCDSWGSYFQTQLVTSTTCTTDCPAPAGASGRRLLGAASEADAAGPTAADADVMPLPTAAFIKAHPEVFVPATPDIAVSTTVYN